MAKIVELESIIYQFPNEENYSEKDNLLLINESIDGKEKWREASRGWEYQNWYVICKRGGMAEAQEIVLLYNNKEKTLTIEEYVERYRKLIAERKPIEELFDRFTVKAKAWRNKEILNSEYYSKYIPKKYEKLEKEYQMVKVDETEEALYYEMDILNIAALMEVNEESGFKEFGISLYFEEKEGKRNENIHNKKEEYEIYVQVGMAI